MVSLCKRPRPEFAGRMEIRSGTIVVRGRLSRGVWPLLALTVAVVFVPTILVGGLADTVTGSREGLVSVAFGSIAAKGLVASLALDRRATSLDFGVLRAAL